MRRLIIIGLLFLATPCFSQKEITWETLTDVRFIDKYSEEVHAYYYYPLFGPSVKALEGKEVYLQGFFLAVDPDEGIYMLSRYPFSACFFCGKSGPESVVQLYLKNKPKFNMDEIVTLKGKFKLNQDDLYQCNYILDGAEPYDP